MADKYRNQLAHARRLLQAYRGTNPLHLYLAQAFKERKGFGNRDRKRYRALLYSFFRAGFAAGELSPEGQLMAGAALLRPPEAEALLRAWWEEHPAWALEGDDPEARLRRVPPQWGFCWRFPYAAQLGGSFSETVLRRRIWQRPALFVHVAPQHRAALESHWREQALPWKRLSVEGAYQLPTETAGEQVAPKKLAPRVWVQDIHSQMSVAQAWEALRGCWWDVCAGAGGKSLIAKALVPELRLWATDIRKGSIAQLTRRMRQTGHRAEEVAVRDLSRQRAPSHWPLFDGLLVDAPCSGSGTWARHPENLLHPYAAPESMARVQRAILEHALPSLKPGGRLLYITCSVFEPENEAIVGWLRRHKGLSLRRMEYLDRHPEADVLFVAELQKTAA
jgi:16S rRNA (cytosine967-C5)-methyltransferase